MTITIVLAFPIWLVGAGMIGMGPRVATPVYLFSLYLCQSGYLRYSPKAVFSESRMNNEWTNIVVVKPVAALIVITWTVRC